MQHASIPSRPSRSIRRGALFTVAAALAWVCAIPQAHADAMGDYPPPSAGMEKANTIAEAFAKADTNHDEKLSKDEAKALPAIAEKFGELDKNQDGVLSFEEFKAGFKTDAAK